MICVLDEIANTVRWRDLPDLYSHYGSRGILLMAILQSYAQGKVVWGDTGMEKLWSSANNAIYGGGVREVGFLENLAKLIGPYDKNTRSVSVNHKGERQINYQLQKERILDVDQLAALPPARAILFASGSRPVMIEPLPWFAGPHADVVRESIATYDPGANRTLAEADKGLNEWTRAVEPSPEDLEGTWKQVV